MIGKWDMNFEERLNFAMGFRGVNAKELAQRSGISESRISQYRKGVYRPKREAMIKLAEALTISPNWLDGTGESIEIYPTYHTVQDLSPFEMRLLNQFQRAPENVQKAICTLLNIDPHGEKLDVKFTKTYSEEEISNFGM